MNNGQFLYEIGMQGMMLIIVLFIVDGICVLMDSKYG